MRIRTAMPFLAVLGVLLSGCSGDSDDDPTTLPSLSATPFATASPVPIPPAARAKTPVGAVAFVRFYFDRVSDAFSHADPSALKSLSDPDCGTCASYIATAERFRKDGQYINGTAVRVVTAEAPPLNNGLIAVDVQLDAPARSIVSTSGTLVRKLPPDPRYHVTVYVKPASAGWVVRAVQNLPS